MKAILLCAGQGKRLMPLTRDRPKCLVEVAGVTMLERQIRTLAATGIDEIVVATGFCADQVEAMLAEMDGPLPPLRTALNPFFNMSDNLTTCWLLRHEMHNEFLLVNGDTLFERGVAESVLNTRGSHSVSMAISRKTEFDDDDMKVVLDADRVAAVGKQQFERIDAESIGMLAFDGDGATQFRATLDEMMRDPAGQSRWYLSAVDRLARAKRVGFCDIGNARWCEIDTPADLARAPASLGLQALPERVRIKRIAP